MSYRKVSGIVFGVVAIAHGLRAALGGALIVGGFSVPVWMSGVAALGAGVLCLWAFIGHKS